MSWLRTAVNRAVEAGGKAKLSRNLRNYADSVVLHAGNAVSGGAKLIQDRIGSMSLKNFRLTVKRLEEMSVNCRGIERVQLLRRWLISLKEVERLSSASCSDNYNNISHDERISDVSKDSPKKPILVCYVDPELGTMNFRDVFLYSQALEGITLSMILEAPNSEEVSLLLEIFGVCLAGRKEVHKAVMTSIQDLATAFCTYQDEVLIKREELLQYAQDAIAGLKTNADIARIDVEACNLMEEIERTKAYHQPQNEASEKSSEATTTPTDKVLTEMLEQIHLCSVLESLLLKKRSLSNKDSAKVHLEKVAKLKVLSESLLNSNSKAELRISEHRSQKEEALNFRLAKANEVSQIEKELLAEIGELENKKDELEDELKKVHSSLNAVRARLRNFREERDQFDEASNQILMHLKSKEVELSRSINSCRKEADVVNTWIKFLEESWVLQETQNEEKNKQVNELLESYGSHFMNLVIHLLTSYKDKLETLIVDVKRLAADLKSSQGSEEMPVINNERLEALNQRQRLEGQYLDIEAKISSTLSVVVDSIKKQYYSNLEGNCRKDDDTIKQLFTALEKMKVEFESIERPVLEAETATTQALQPTSTENSCESPLPTSTRQSPDSRENKEDQQNQSFPFKEKMKHEMQIDLDDLSPEAGYDDTGHGSREIADWVYDAHVLENDNK